MAGDLRTARDKLARAREHREALADEIKSIIPYDPRWNLHGAYTVHMESEDLGNEIRFYLDLRAELDLTRSAVLLGDALFNLRSALDHVAFQLHVRHYRGRVPTSMQQRSAFPILNAARKTDSSAWPEIGVLGRRQRRAIEFLQPYNRRNDRHQHVRPALHEINVLNNIDKHRRLHVMRAAAAGFDVPDLGAGSTVSVYAYQGALHGGQLACRWEFPSRPRNLASLIERFGHAIVQIRLDEPGVVSSDVLPLLDAHANSVEQIISRFDAFFR